MQSSREWPGQQGTGESRADARSQGLHWWQVRFLPRVFSRPVAALATVVLLALFLGCMSLNIGNTRPSEDGVTTQTGTVTLRECQPQTVYYPIPYVSTPNLTLHDDWGNRHWEIVEQQWDHFTVRQPATCPELSTVEVTWTAKGLKGPPPPAAVVVAPPAKGQQAPPPSAVPTEPDLPPMPIPVTPAEK